MLRDSMTLKLTQADKIEPADLKALSDGLGPNRDLSRHWFVKQIG
jgi:hypothetical protein